MGLAIASELATVVIATGTEMKREPTDQEHESIRRAVANRDRIQATSLYMGITECGLTQAQDFVRRITTDLGKDTVDNSPAPPKKWFRTGR